MEDPRVDYADRSIKRAIAELSAKRIIVIRHAPHPYKARIMNSNWITPGVNWDAFREELGLAKPKGNSAKMAHSTVPNWPSQKCQDGPFHITEETNSNYSQDDANASSVGKVEMLDVPGVGITTKDQAFAQMKAQLQKSMGVPASMLKEADFSKIEEALLAAGQSAGKTSHSLQAMSYMLSQMASSKIEPQITYAGQLSTPKVIKGAVPKKSPFWTLKDTKKILAGLREAFESHHNVKYTADAIRTAVADQIST